MKLCLPKYISGDRERPLVSRSRGEKKKKNNEKFTNDGSMNTDWIPYIAISYHCI